MKKPAGASRGTKSKTKRASESKSRLLIETARVDRRALDVVDLHEQRNDVAYWRTRSVNERLEALELMRQIAYGYDPSTERLQRILEVVEFGA
ncbi:MAG: hypothetical protein IT450_23810 [Phycisphaerales bacterium]|nr:hypothetical protein [Phycisphaerales bacterium]